MNLGKWVVENACCVVGILRRWGRLVISVSSLCSNSPSRWVKRTVIIFRLVINRLSYSFVRTCIAKTSLKIYFKDYKISITVSVWLACSICSWMNLRLTFRDVHLFVIGSTTHHFPVSRAQLITIIIIIMLNKVALAFVLVICSTRTTISVRYSR